MPILDLAHHQLYYKTQGDPASPQLLILSGLTDYTAKCRWQTRVLAHDVHVITFDNLGAGRSSIRDFEYTVADLAVAAAAFFNGL